MEAGGSIFNAMLQEFDGAARLLGLDPGHLENPHASQAADHRVLPDPDGQRRDRGLHRLPRPIQHHARPGQGRHPLSPRRHARRSHGARGVDDVEVRRRAHPVRRRQGRRHLRSDADVAPRARGADAPLRRRDHRRHRPGEGRAGARRQHQRSDHGVGDGHLQHARRPHVDRGRHRQADRDGRLARPPRSDRPRRDDRDARSGEAPRLRHQGRDASPCRASATSARSRPICSSKIGAKIVAVTDWKGGVYNAERPRHREDARLRQAAQDRSTASPAASRSTTTQLFALDVDVLDSGGARKPDHDGERAGDPGEGRRRRAPTARRRRTRTSTCTSAASSSSPTSSPTPAASPRRTSSGCRIATATSGRKTRSTSASRRRCARRSTTC